MRAWLARCWARLFPPPVYYYTVDGGHLAPYPNMTDEELADFEEYFGITPGTDFSQPGEGFGR